MTSAKSNGLFAAVAKAVAIAAKAATEAPNKKMTRIMMSMSPIDMIYLPVAALTVTLSLLALEL